MGGDRLEIKEKLDIVQKLNEYFDSIFDKEDDAGHRTKAGWLIGRRVWKQEHLR